MRIVILGSHPRNSPSMRRYTSLLADAYESSGHDVITARPTSAFSQRLKNRSLAKWVAYVEQLILFPFALARLTSKADILHVADHSDALLLLTIPRLPTTLVTCHDLIAIQAARGELPEHRARATGRFYQWLVVRGIRRAAKLVGVSETTSHEMRAIMSVPPITTVLNPLSPVIRASEPGIPDPTLGKYALVVSSVGWRKRRELSLKAWGELRTSGGMTTLRTVLVGPPLTNREKAVLKESGLPESEVTTVRNISDVELATLYTNSEFLIQMSQYEGFCWPIIESNFYARLALCADEPILRETGDGNVFVGDNLDADWPRIASELQSIEARTAAQERAAGYTFERFAEGIDAVAAAAVRIAKRV